MKNKTNKNYSAKQLIKIVKKYAKEDGCVHYVLKEEDGTISQTCDPWIDYQDINEYIKENNMELLAIIEPW